MQTHTHTPLSSNVWIRYPYHNCMKI